MGLRGAVLGRMVLAGVLACTFTGTLWISASPAGATGPAFTFNPGLPLLTSSGGNTGAGEPTIDVDTEGNAYVTGPVGVPTGGCPFWTVHPGTLNSKGLPYDYRGRFDIDYHAPGGGDCDITHGPRSALVPNADSVAVSSLNIAPNVTNNTSQDAGQTFKDPALPYNPGFVPGADRQWNAADPTLHAYYEVVHDFATDNIQFSVSYDSGYSYTPNSPAITPTDFPAAEQDNHFSKPVVDPRTHKIYIAYVAPANATENGLAVAGTTGPNEHVVWVAVGDPCATTPCTPLQPIGPVSWTDYVAYPGPAGQDYANIFPTISLDRAGNIYVAWAGDTSSSASNRVYEIHAKASDPSSWSAPFQVAEPQSHSNVFPWISAGREGVLDMTWYEGRLVGSGSACPTNQTGTPNDSNGVNNNCFNVWHVEFAQITNANTSSPVLRRSPASSVMHRGSICEQGLACTTGGGDRTLLDFFSMSLDPAGGANIAYASDVQSPGTAQIEYTRQCTGASAILVGVSLNRACGALVPPAPTGPTSVCSGNPLYTDPAGDAVNPTGAPNTAAASTDSVDITSTSAAATSPSNVDVTMQLVNLQKTPPPGTTDEYYYVTWTGPDGKQYAVEQAEPEPPGAEMYYVGQFDTQTNQMTTQTPITGSFNPGPGGTIVWNVPRADIGNPTIPISTTSSTKPAFTQPYSLTIVGEGSATAGGLVFVQPADRAPNGGFGPKWSVC